MDYVELNVRVTDPELAEILTAELAELPYESFQTEGEVLKAYIPRERLADCMQQTDDLLARYGIADRRYIAIESQNWNALWEQNFTPVDVDGRILIRAPFHASQPGYELEVVVMPRMAFGSGHHATTCLVASALCDLSLTGKRGLDMGCGTGVLAIVAAKRGAATVDAVDIDEWAEANCRENAAANGLADRSDAGRCKPHRGPEVRFHRGQHQPQYPHDGHAGLCRGARYGRRSADERIPGGGCTGHRGSGSGLRAGAGRSA